MSNLNSIFDTLRGWPNGSALENNFTPDPNVASLVEGTVVKIEGRQLADVSALSIVDNTLVTAPTLTATDAGNAYVVAGTGGGWSTFDVGDVVEWDGAAWNLLVAAVEAEVATGTRVIVAAASAAGDFAGHEEKVAQYTKHTVELTCAAGGYVDAVPTDIGKPVTSTGSGDSGHLVSYDNATRKWIVDPDTPADVFQAADVLAITGGTGAGTVDTGGVAPLGGAWAFVTPVNGNRVLVDASGSIYDGLYYDYVGTHATGVWALATEQRTAKAIVSKLSSNALTSTPKDDAWLVIQGNDQWDAQFTGVVTCLKMRSGCAYKIQHDSANSLVAGTLVEAASGVLQAFTNKWPVGQVIYSNGVAGSEGYIVVASF